MCGLLLPSPIPNRGLGGLEAAAREEEEAEAELRRLLLIILIFRSKRNETSFWNERFAEVFVFEEASKLHSVVFQVSKSQNLFPIHSYRGRERHFASSSASSEL